MNLVAGAAPLTRANLAGLVTRLRPLFLPWVITLNALESWFGTEAPFRRPVPWAPELATSATISLCDAALSTQRMTMRESLRPTERRNMSIFGLDVALTVAESFVGRFRGSSGALKVDPHLSGSSLPALIDLSSLTWMYRETTGR